MISTTKEAYAFPVFEAVFKEFGLPKVIRTDNGVPFASPNALYELSKLLVRWLRLGIAIERIKPGHPQQNGRHERMHLTLKSRPPSQPATASCNSRPGSTTSSTATTTRGRTRRSTCAIRQNANVPSSRPSRGLTDLDYPFHEINLSVVFAGQKVSVKQVSEEIWLLSFMDYDLGHFDHETCRFELLSNPFGPKVLQPPSLQRSQCRSKAASERASTAP